MERYIKTDEAMHELAKVFKPDEFPKIVRAISSTSTADVRENVHAHWIKHKDRTCWYCSCCNTDNYYAYARGFDTAEYEFQDHYCPHCGAKMEG